MNKKCLLILVLLTITAVYNLPMMKSPLSPYDEGVILVGAERVLKGQVPYKDFLTVYGPGQVYTLAALFKIFGISVTVERIYDIVIKSFLSLSVYLLIRLLSSNKTAIVGWIMSLIWIEYSYNHAYPVYPAVLFTFLGIYLLLLHIRRDRPLFIVLCAVSIVIAIIFRHDLGGLAAVAIAIGLFLRKILGAQKSWTQFILYMVSGVCVSLPVIIYFLLNSDLGAIIEDLFLIPMDMVAIQQRLPYPPLTRWNLPFYVFPLVLPVGLITFVILRKRKMDDVLSYGIFFLSLIGTVFLNQVWGRSDTLHLLPVALTGIVLSPVLFHTFSKMLTQSTRIYFFLFMLFIIFFGVTLSKAISKKIQLFPGSYTIEVINPDIERAKYPFIPPDYRKVVSFIKKNSSADDYIYVGVKNHDQLVFNDAIFYFLAEKKSATKYHELNPGHTTTLEIQEEMVDELKNRNPRLVVLATRRRLEPNPSGIDTNIDLLDNYISTNFVLKETYGLFEIWMTKSTR
jgi:hypothetical protein